MPLVGAALVYLVPSGPRATVLARQFATAVACLQLLGVLYLGSTLDWSKGGIQALQSFAWPLTDGVDFSLAVDGLSWLMLLLGALALLGAVVAQPRTESGPSPSDASNTAPAENALLLAAHGCLALAILATNLYPLLLAAQLMILIIYAGSTRLGLILSQVALLGLIVGFGAYYHASASQGIQASADIYDLQSQAGSWTLTSTPELGEGFPMWALSLQVVCCVALLGVFPFHRLRPQTLSTDAADNSKTSTAADLAGHLPAMLAAYMLIRFVLPLAPASIASAAPWMLAWGGVGIAFTLWSRNFSQQLIPCLILASLGATTLSAPSSAAAGLLLSAMFFLAADVTLGPLLRRGKANTNRVAQGLAIVPLVLLLILQIATPGISATLEVVQRTLIGEDLG